MERTKYKFSYHTVLIQDNRSENQNQVILLQAATHKNMAQPLEYVLHQTISFYQNMWQLFAFHGVYLPIFNVLYQVINPGVFRKEFQMGKDFVEFEMKKISQISKFYCHAFNLFHIYNCSTYQDMSRPGYGEGNDNPLQYSGLESLMDRGVWQSIVHGVAESQTWLEQLSTHTDQGKSITSKHKTLGCHHSYQHSFTSTYVRQHPWYLVMKRQFMKTLGYDIITALTSQKIFLQIFKKLHFSDQQTIYIQGITYIFPDNFLNIINVIYSQYLLSACIHCRSMSGP